MRKIFLFMYVIALIPLTINAQEDLVTKKKGNIGYAFTIGFFSGIDFDINAYRFNSNYFGNNFYNKKPEFNIGMDYGWMISKNLRPRIELKYIKMSYSAGWDNANITSLKESVVYLYRLGASLRMDYLFLDKSKLQLFISPALKWEFNMNSDEKNISYDGSFNWANYNGIIKENPKNILGVAVSTIFKYNITKNIGITATPEYTLFFRNFVESNDRIYQRVNVNFGFEFNFY